MPAILLGDIVASRKLPPKDWLPVLKAVLGQFGKSPGVWDITRGDGFQLMVPVEEAFHAAVLIRSRLKSIDPLDVRMGIGLGLIDYQAKNIAESNGAAFHLAGTAFDSLGEEGLKILSGITEIDQTLGLIFQLWSKLTGSWTPLSGTLIYHRLLYPHLTQRELSAYIFTTQSAISQGLSRAYFEEFQQIDKYFRKHIKDKFE